MKTDKPATIKEIAKRLKISPSTVSRALNDHPSIGLVTTMRVKKMAVELNYEPNQTAIFFKQRKTFTIGVILPSLSEPFFTLAINEIENLANTKDYTVLLGQSLDDEVRELKIIQTFKKHRVDGILMSVGKNTTDFSFIDLLNESKIPIVFFDCVPDSDHVHKVFSDLTTGMDEAIEAFCSRGHLKIALINGPKSLLASEQRLDAYKKALKKHKIPFDDKYVVNTDLTEKGNENAMEALCALSERPSAIVSFNDFVTLDVMKYARQRGIVLNQDMHFISYANYPLWKYIENPPMGSIEQYPGEQGQRAAEILFEAIETKEDMEPKVEVFESKLVLK
ncbi:LacI family DNA-binding transcriptional regulator [Sphingobacterium hungaricum]|uniref:LacI family transcriptional regulator n=1 Tax=Sphingobacterium hungaricum TaxID=2082723 RepID=A0A928YQ80_9SPHI|nr:LacI family DNA-binding transcriptional regulator [Sphingobacterium hungaricum]MBE8713307.1 LacI family transcriptional regulator [Sphingobacterium hungaricum]